MLNGLPPLLLFLLVVVPFEGELLLEESLVLPVLVAQYLAEVGAGSIISFGTSEL